jgi:hypothetical protein
MSISYDWIEASFTPSPNTSQHPTLGPLVFSDADVAGGSFFGDVSIGFSGILGVPPAPISVHTAQVTFNADNTLTGFTRLGNGSEGFTTQGAEFDWMAQITADGLSTPINETGHWIREVPEPTSVAIVASLLIATAIMRACLSGRGQR